MLPGSDDLFAFEFFLLMSFGIMHKNLSLFFSLFYVKGYFSGMFAGPYLQLKLIAWKKIYREGEFNEVYTQK